MSQPVKILGSSRTCTRVKAFPERSATPSRSSLWHNATRPPFLQSRAWQIEKTAPHQLKWDRKSGGSMPLLMKREYLNLYAPNSVPLTVEGSTESHTPVRWIRPSRRASGFNATARASPMAVFAYPACLHNISSLPYPIMRAWSPDLNSAVPSSAVTRCPVIMQDAAQFAPTVRFGSGRVIPDCLTGRLVIELPGIWAVAPWKRSGRKMSCNESSTTWKAIPMSGVTRCTKDQSCWRYFCRCFIFTFACWTTVEYCFEFRNTKKWMAGIHHYVFNKNLLIFLEYSSWWYIQSIDHNQVR